MSIPTVGYEATRAQSYAKFSRPTFSAAILLDIAGDALAQIEKLKSEEHSVSSRHLLDSIAEDAITCAAHLEVNKIQEIRFVGPFGVLPFKRKVRVRIAKGARIFSTANSVPQEGQVIGRARVVTLHDASMGYIDKSSRPYQVLASKITWVGSGGYWYWTDANNAEVFEGAGPDVDTPA